jgi:hypothetical protein
MFAAKTGMSSTRSVVMVSASVISEAYPISKISSKNDRTESGDQKIFKMGGRTKKPARKQVFGERKLPFLPIKWGVDGVLVPRVGVNPTTKGL